MKLTLFFLLTLSLPLLALADDECSPDGNRSKAKSLPLKLAAIFSILFFGAFGVCLPITGKWIPAVRPEKDVFFIVKAFAAGVILATGFIHILPDGFDNLTSSCLPEHPWTDFPFAGFIAMVTAIVTLMIDSFATAYYSSTHFGKNSGVRDEEKSSVENDEVVHVHTHATHGHAHGSTADHEGDGLSLIRHRVISQAKFKARSMVTMILFFSLTTPTGIAIGIGISSVYDENSHTALIVEGVLNSASAGILIYMALVDLLAADFMNPRVRSSGKLQLGVNVSLLIGAGLMSLIAKWA